MRFEKTRLKPTWFHKAGWITLSLFVGLILLVGAFEWAEWPFLRKPLEQQLSKALQRPVVLGHDFGMRFLSGVHLRTDSLSVGARLENKPLPAQASTAAGTAAGPAAGTAAGTAAITARSSASGVEVKKTESISLNLPLLQASHIDLDIPYSSIINFVRGQRQDLRITSLVVNQIDAVLIRDADGHTNWEGPTSTKPSTPTNLPNFDHLLVNKGNIQLDDARTDLHLAFVIRTQEGSAQGTAPSAINAPAAVASTTSTPPSSGLDIAVKGRYKAANITASLQASGLMPLASSSPNSPAVPFTLDAKTGSSHLHLNGTSKDVIHLTLVEGDYKLRGPSLAAVGDVVGVTLPTTAPFVIRGHINKQANIWQTTVQSLELGSSRLKGEFRFDEDQSPPLFTGELRGPLLALRDLGPAFGAPPIKPAPGVQQRLLPQSEFDLPKLHAMNADVSVNLDAADLGTSQLEKLAPLKSHVTLKSGLLVLDDIQAKTSGGELRGKLSLDSTPTIPIWKGDVHWSGIQLDRFIKTRNPYIRTQTNKNLPEGSKDVQQKQPGYVSGQYGGRAQLNGVGRSTAQMLGSLEGSMQFWVNNGQISHLLVEAMGIDIAESIGLFFRGDKNLPMQCAVAGFTAHKGLLHADVALIDTKDTTFNITGDISLATEQIGLTLVASPKDKSLFSLRSPLYIDGSFVDPQVHLDIKSMGVRVAAATALAIVSPFTTLLALIDLGEPEKAVCDEAVKRVQTQVQTQAQTKLKTRVKTKATSSSNPSSKAKTAKSTD